MRSTQISSCAEPDSEEMPTSGSNGFARFLYSGIRCYSRSGAVAAQGRIIGWTGGILLYRPRVSTDNSVTCPPGSYLLQSEYAFQSYGGQHALRSQALFLIHYLQARPHDRCLPLTP